MKRTVTSFALFVLVMVMTAVPSFACEYCGADSRCHPDVNSGTYCTNGLDYCYEDWGCVDGAAARTLLDSYSVASVEVTQPRGVTRKVADAPQKLASTNVHETSRTR